MTLTQPAGGPATRAWTPNGGSRRSSAPAWVGRLLELDLALVAGALAMAVVGAVMVYSATRSGLLAAGLSPHYWLKRDAMFLGMGAAVMAVLAFVDYHRWEGVWGIVYAGLIVALVAVMMPHIGQNKLGSTRWLPLGPFQFQPSAFAALVVIVAVAAVSSQANGAMSWRRLAVVVGLAAGAMAFVAKQPDLGSAIVIGIVTATMIVVGGAKARQLAVLALVTAAAVFAVIHLGMLHGYQVTRLTSFLHPHQGTNSVNYNLTQSKIDIGAGGLFGKGLLHDPQTNLRYVPEQQTDFIFTAVGGQLGFVGSASVLVLYGLIVMRLWRAARVAPDTFGTLLSTGAFALITFSVFENAGMTMGIMPITGIPLPLMSYGGSADIAFFAAIGIALNVGRRSAPRSGAVTSGRRGGTTAIAPGRYRAGNL